MRMMLTTRSGMKPRLAAGASKRGGSWHHRVMRARPDLFGIVLGIAFAACRGSDEDAMTRGSASGSETADEGGSATAGDATDDSAGESGENCERAPATASEDCPSWVGQSLCSEGAMHVVVGSNPEWNNNPPHSGPHYPTAAPWGDYATLERGHWVHSLEHGGIVLLHDCPQGCADELAQLRSVRSLRPEARIIMTHDPLLEASRFAAVAWTWVYEFDTVDLDALTCFIDQHEGNAPEDIP